MTLFFISSFIAFLGLLNLFGIGGELALRQGTSLILAVVGYFSARVVKKTFFYLLNYLFYFLFLLNLYLLFFGEEIKGAKRWIKFFGFTLQPSELFLIVFIFFLAKVLTERYARVFDLWVFIKSFGFALLSFFVVYLQPDLATSLEFLFVYIVLLIFSPLDKKYFYYLLIAGFIIAPIFWLSLKPYQKERITAFLKKTAEVEKVNYNMRQAEISIGAGGIFGQGLGRASQVRLAFLPEKHTDFAFASFVSQTGFLGGSFLLLLYILLLYKLGKQPFLEFVFQKKISFASLVRIGLAAHVFYRVFVNIGMNLGVLPIAGVPLILFSFGGSSLLAFYFGLGVVEEDS